MNSLVRRARELHPVCKVPVGASGEWRVERFAVENAEGGGIDAMSPGTYTALSQGSRFRVMSDIDGELIEHVPFIEKAHGRVLITGLGLGLLPCALLAYGKVAHIDIVELERDVIDLVWPHVKDTRITLHHADAYAWDAYAWDACGRSWDFCYHDITYFGRDFTECCAMLRARFNSPVQDVWGERGFTP